MRPIALAKAILLRRAPESILLWLKKLHYPRALRKFDELDVPVVRELVNQGDHVIDISAYVGWYSKILADEVGRTGRVYSFEPVPQTFSLLSYCVGKLGLQNVMLLNCGLSDKDGVAQMEIPTYSSGGEDFYKSRITPLPQSEALRGRLIEVETKRLDSFCASLESDITFIKCDVEGHELAVLRGADATIRKHMPAWLIEIWSDPDLRGSDGQLVFELLEKRGYNGYWYDGRLLRLRRRQDKSINYFFLSDEHLHKIRHAGLLGCRNR